ncbi:MAG TPA: hypothetical protein VMM92_13565, partial [Thermoanaerobaculia bacterium]|nr:hypothetical protein [Thermoanaerobaculia bacterium]
MRKTLPVLSLGLVLLASGGLRAGEVVDSLVKTENAFAAAAAAQGVKAAFLTYLAEDAVIFRPTAVAGVTWFREHPSPPITLLWHPTYA